MGSNMETSQAGTRAYKEFFPSHGEQYHRSTQENIGVTSDTESEEEGGFIETAQEVTEVHKELEYNRTSSSSSASGFSLQCDEFWPKENNSVQNSPQLNHPTAGRVKAPKRRPPSYQLLKQNASSVFSSDEDSGDLASEKANFTESRTSSKYYIDVSNNQNVRKSDHDVSNFLDNDEMVLAEYASSHSLLDSILTTIDVDNVSNRVEFPEYGKSLMENVSSSQIDPVSMVKMDSKTWGDNWKVDGINKFEEQVFLDVDGQKKMKRTLTPEVVPLLVPQSSDRPRVIIGGKDVDEVSVLSEKMSVGSIEYSSSESEEDMADIDVQNETIETFLREESKTDPAVYHDELIISNNPPLSLLSAPGDIHLQEGRILSQSCSVLGIKPIDVCWFHSGNVLRESPSCLLSQTGNTHSLTMFNLTREQAGQYSLAVVNSQGEVWHSFNVGVTATTSVAHTHPAIIESPTSTHAEEGQAMVVSCRVEGFPEPRVDFFKGGKLIKNNDNFTVEYHGHGVRKMTMARVGLRDEGTFSMSAYNCLGSSTKDWNLTVLSSMAHDDYDDIEIYADESVVSGDISDQEFIDTMHNKLEMSVGTKIDEKHPNKSDRGILFLDTDVGETNTEDVDLFDELPTPGSLADREHRKWLENAVPMPNNPYTTENIILRKFSRSIMNQPQPSQVGFATNHDLVVEDNIPKKIDCGLRDVDAGKYKRNYYINENKEKKSEPKINSGLLSFRWSETEREKRQSESSQSSDNQSDDVDNNEEIRVTDSGVDSEQTSTSNNSILEDMRRDEAISVFAEESSDDVSSICSTENIDKEIVAKMKNRFEEQIIETKEKQSTFLNWKKSNLHLKPKEISPAPTETNTENEPFVPNISAQSSDSESSNSTVEILNNNTVAEQETRQVEHVAVLGKADEGQDRYEVSSDSNSDYENEKKKIIGKNSVNRLKCVYEDIATKKKGNNSQHVQSFNLNKTTSLMNLRTGYMSTESFSKSHNNVNVGGTGYIKEKEIFHRKDGGL